MIIPIKCFGCGNELANLYRVYLEQVKAIKLTRGDDPDRIVYLTGEPMEITPEKEVMNKLGITRYCCRKHLLTHRDLIDKI